MSNIITLEDLDDDYDYTALLEDLKEGCERLGTVVSIHVPRIHVFDLIREIIIHSVVKKLFLVLVLLLCNIILY